MSKFLIQEIDLVNANFDDPIFASLRQDYPDFDSWLNKIKHLSNRKMVLSKDDKGFYRAVAILKYNSSGSVKLSTFKVNQSSWGHGLGTELMLQVIEENKGKQVYIQVKPKYTKLLRFLAHFGFTIVESKSNKNDDLTLAVSL